MKEHLVPYDTAVELKAKGFDWECPEIYGTPTHVCNSSLGYDSDPYAPTLSLAAKWLRDEHGRYILPIPTVTSAWTFKIIRVTCKKDFEDFDSSKVEQPPYEGVHAHDYHTYEQALLEGINEALKLI